MPEAGPVDRMRGRQRWAQIANPLISEANFFTSGFAAQLTFKNVSGLVIEATFFSQSANPLEKKVATEVFIQKRI